jgi:hypothetical protein
MEDLAGSYSLPCVVDAKIGLQTWYPWGSDKLIGKCRWVGWVPRAPSLCLINLWVYWPGLAGVTAAIISSRTQPRSPTRTKDASTTQSLLGFRICGVKVSRSDGSEWRADRHWGKGLGRAGALEALRRFADNGGWCGWGEGRLL